MKKYIIGLGVFIASVLLLGMCLGDGGGDDDTALADAVTDEFVDVSAKEESPSEADVPTVMLSEKSSDGLPIEKEILSLLIVQSAKDIPSQILTRISYITSYNNVTKCPNWVSWHLTSNHTDGPFKRDGVPYYDESGQNAYGIGMVTNENYQNGYFLDTSVKGPRQEFIDWKDKSYNVNHGHMCPAGDNKWDKEAMNQTFILTNICPQDENLNGGGWRKLEEKCRSWAKRYGDIFIITGPIFNGNSISRTIGEGKIGVPDAFFKVVLCMKSSPKAIGFIYANDSSSQYIEDKVCSIDEIENLIGFDFFSELPDEIENALESSSNYNNWK